MTYEYRDNSCNQSNWGYNCWEDPLTLTAPPLVGVFFLNNSGHSQRIQEFSQQSQGWCPRSRKLEDQRLGTLAVDTQWWPDNHDAEDVRKKMGANGSAQVVAKHIQLLKVANRVLNAPSGFFGWGWHWILHSKWVAGPLAGASCNLCLCFYILGWHPFSWMSLSHQLALFELRCPVKCNLILIRSNLSGSPRFFFGSRSHRSPLQKDTTGAASATSAASD